jgi:predicted DNA-binding transcriptional regulator YafY
LILPYGWYSSKEGNVLLMCYKVDTNEVRSYRLDRIISVEVNDSLMNTQNEDNTTVNNPNDFEIPEIPDIDEILNLSENELPYDEGIEYLTNGGDENNEGQEVQPDGGI